MFIELCDYQSSLKPCFGVKDRPQIVDEFADDWGRSTSKECQAGSFMTYDNILIYMHIIYIYVILYILYLIYAFDV